MKKLKMAAQMSNCVPISLAEHSNRAWRRFENYEFCRHQTFAPIVMAELHKAVIHLPLGFVRDEGGFQLVAVYGLDGAGAENLFLEPDGTWGGYVPAVHRGHPFSLKPASGDQLLLCVDDSCEVVGTAGELGWDQPFFTSDGKPAKVIQEIAGFLQQVHASGLATRQACNALAAEDLIVPWSLSVQGPDGLISRDDIFRVDEQRLSELEGQALKRLHALGAVFLAHAQLISRQHVSKLQQLYAKRREAAALTAGHKTQDQSFLNGSAPIGFEGKFSFKGL